ncbi:MAG TPA: hypothetical protein DCM87_15790, partial [Planctomycetes bacterium]|nr:hypothetical protein [Planctomycetota bacterium]
MKNPSLLCALCVSCACLSAGEDAGALFVKAFAESAARVVLADGSDAPAALALERRADGVFQRWTLVNRTDRRLHVREIVLADAAHGLPPETGFYGEGCQMLSQTAGTLGRMVDLDHYTDRGHYRLPEPEGFRTVYGLVTLSPPGGGHAMAAFTTCRRFAGKFNVNAVRLRAVIDAEDRAIEPAERWDLEETVWAHGPDRDELLALLAARIVANHGRLPFPKLPAGWCSWYCFGPAIDREKIRGNCEAIRARIPELRFVQIDDGYQPAMGDWLETGPAFGGGVQDVLRTIREAGLEPAIWVAPFVASPGSKLFAEHPEWFVKDAEGRPLRSDRVMFGGWRLGPWYVLDGTHPEAQRHLAGLFRTMRDEWGCTYFKLDATFWGMIRGGRFHDERATGVEAYRRGMEAIRRGAGDAFILGCNHPIWASFGLIHGSRSSMDVGKSWSGFAGTARENLMRAWQNDRLWWNDPDCVVLDTKEPAAVRSFHTAAIYATGGMVLSGDDLRNAPPEKLAVLRALAANRGKAARFETADLEVGWIDEAGRRVLVLLNWSDKPARREAALAAPARVGDLFSGEDLGVRRERIVIEAMPPRSGRVLIVEPAAGARRTISLDGAWQVAEGGLEERPAKFDRTVPVPGLVDMAAPPFDEPGPKVADRRSGAQRDPRREAFWYRRTFVLPEAAGAVARLKIHKAMFGARAWLNGKDLGVHMPCFTPGIFGVREALRAGENEIVIRVGASRDQIPPSQPDGFDYEKSRYIPGIFDRVELILAGEPFIENVQVAPDIGRRGARVRVRLSRGGAPVSLRVREAASGREVGSGEAGAPSAAAEAFVPIEGCRLWSPDDPFLYELVVRTEGDELATRF